MPNVRRQSIPPPVLEHLLDRIRLREISADQLNSLVEWLDTKPQVPDGDWFKRLSGMVVCGRGELVLTFLTTNQVPFGDEIR